MKIEKKRRINEVYHFQLWHRLYIKVEKCEFYSNSIEYLEYILSSFRSTMSSDKINTIQNLVWTEESQGCTSIFKVHKFLLLIYL